MLGCRSGYLEDGRKVIQSLLSADIYTLNEGAGSLGKSFESLDRIGGCTVCKDTEAVVARKLGCTAVVESDRLGSTWCSKPFESGRCRTVGAVRR